MLLQNQTARCKAVAVLQQPDELGAIAKAQTAVPHVARRVARKCGLTLTKRVHRRGTGVVNDADALMLRAAIKNAITWMHGHGLLTKRATAVLIIALALEAA